MKKFFRLAAGVDTLAIMLALQRRPELWNADRFRTTFTDSPHTQVDDILLRFAEAKPDTATVMASAESVWYPAAAVLAEVEPLVLSVMARVGAWALDRLVITRLAPGGRILPHADDQGEYVHDLQRMRLHVVLLGNHGSLYKCGDETVEMLTGEVWWFDPLSIHEIVNNSGEDRVHLLVDCRTWPRGVKT